MSNTNFNWSTFIAEVTDIPTDVIFQIVEDGQVHEIKAHKMVLGMVSITFKTMFSTTDIGDKTTKEIKIQATTKQAFQVIIDDLYTIKSIEDSLKGKSLQDIFDVVNLIERYQMANLQKSVNDLLFNYPITEDTVLEVAAEAIHQSGLFQKEAHLLLLACAKFLKPKLKDAKSIFKYFEENGDQKEVVAAVMVLMNGIAVIGSSNYNIAQTECSNIAQTECSNIAPTECSNCGYEDCQDGNEVEDDEFREGLLVINNRDARRYPGFYWASDDFGTGKVTRVGPTYVTIETIESGITKQFNGSNFCKTYQGYNCFLFKCN